MRAFEAQTQWQKMAQLWSNLTDVNVVDKSAPAKNIVQAVAETLAESMITVFDDQWEVIPEGRTKVIHSQGVHCKFNLHVPADVPFTGVLAPGNHSGIIRLGSATTLDLGNQLFFPGFGIKFLRSNVRSADWVGLRASGPGGSWDFFGTYFSTHVKPADALVKTGKFQQASGCIDMVGLSDACAYTQEGMAVVQPVFPFELLFESANKTVSPDVKKTNDQLLDELASIPPATEIFTVHAFASPKDKIGGKKTLVGSLSTSVTCHRSLFGDKQLLFRHQMEEDFSRAPEWIEQMKPLGDTACVATQGPVSKWQCVPAPKM